MVDISSNKYSVLPRYKKVLIITDSTVAGLYLWDLHRELTLRECSVYEVILPSGESSKSLENVQMIYEILSDAAFSRSDYIVALGGGVITDISGFCAATYLRGLNYISIPTTLLAMVDAAHGGKCGVDLKYGKNLVGTFYDPEHIIIDVNFLKTLPKAVFAEGMAEVIKYAFIMDSSLYEMLNEFLVKFSLVNIDIKEDIKNNNYRFDDETLRLTEEIIYRCVEDKNSIVIKDKNDHGIRRILNFGHTFGHAIEAISNYKVSHGYSVAVGMVMITKLSVKSGKTNERVLKSLIKMLKDFELPTDISEIGDFLIMPEEDITDKISNAVIYDKKHDGDELYVVIADSIGSSKIIKYEELK